MTTQSELRVKKFFINLSGLELAKDIHPGGFSPLTHEILEDIIYRITAELPVQKIILFGSYANPTVEITPDSDLDLLVVMETNDPLSKRILSVSRLLRPRPFPMDIIIRTPQEISNLMESNDPFIREIFSTGRMIYERK
jgi:predicted nucleotidyltransferase